MPGSAWKQFCILYINLQSGQYIDIERKRQKNPKKVLTSGETCGIIVKLSRESSQAERRGEKLFSKKYLTNQTECGKIVESPEREASHRKVRARKKLKKILDKSSRVW